eukprot:FR736493.1.p1 GENE.FR736493.1~~FR736493.1.p1  ORF type:complete len:194 (-),score=23.71 FR736493.1:398-979(-)
MDFAQAGAIKPSIKRGTKSWEFHRGGGPLLEIRGFPLAWALGCHSMRAVFFFFFFFFFSAMVVLIHPDSAGAQARYSVTSAEVAPATCANSPVSNPTMNPTCNQRGRNKAHEHALFVARRKVQTGCFTVWTTALNDSGSVTARSARTFRFSSMRASPIPAIKREYPMPCCRLAAFRRSIHVFRNSLFLTLRSR